MEAIARFKNNRRSPRKVRLVADLVRGKDVNQALNLLKFSTKHASKDIEKLILSAISNWQIKNEDADVEEAALYVKRIWVDQGRSLKRFRPAPFGRPHKIRKRSSHISLTLDSKQEQEN